MRLNSVRRALQGVALSLGAPLGWLALRALDGRSVTGELAGQPSLYVYLLVPTAVVFAVFGAVLGLHEDRLERANARLSHDALTDELTRLKNLRYFRARLDEEHAISSREGSPLSLLMIDLDRFKQVNDRFGHLEGDRLLAAIATAIAAVARHGETAARVGGDEFALLLPGASGDDARAAAKRLRDSVAAVDLHIASERVSTTASVGAASTGDLGSVEAEELYRAADRALFEAKAAGGNSTAIARRASPLHSMVTDLPSRHRVLR